MILTCPQCDTRYLLPATTLGAEGRRVKCSSCAEIWHQEPDPDELAEFDEGDEQETDSADTVPLEDSTVEDIPDGVKPIPDSAPVPVLQEDADEMNSRRKMIGSMVAAGLVFVVIFAGLCFAHKPVVSGWPASAAFYELLGMHAPVPGEGLVFDRLTATIDPDGDMEKISVKGTVINLTSDDQTIPLIEASLKDSHDKVLTTWIIPVEEAHLTAESDLSFSTVQSFEKDKAQNVHLRFVLKADESIKPAEGDHAEPTKDKHPSHEEPKHGENHSDHKAKSSSHDEHKPAKTAHH